jgi:hypothetical protein
MALSMLLTAEVMVAAVREASASALFWPCARLRSVAEAVAVLLEHYDDMPAPALPRLYTAGHYFFRDCPDFLGLLIDQARNRFRELRISMVLVHDDELYNSIRNFRQIQGLG